jgi:hypothetical protein
MRTDTISQSAAFLQESGFNHRSGSLRNPQRRTCGQAKPAAILAAGDLGDGYEPTGVVGFFRRKSKPSPSGAQSATIQ